MIDKSLLAKIRKCMALAASANEHEAAAAIAKVRALMDANGLSDADIALAEIEEAAARASRTLKPPRWESYLSATVMRAIGVHGFINHLGDRAFVGRSPAPEIATYAFAVLFRLLKAARAEYLKTTLRRCKPGRKRARADIFCEAWASAVLVKIAAMTPERVADPLIDTYLAEHHPGLVPCDSRAAKVKGKGASDDYWNGRSAGGKVDVSMGLNGSKTPELLA